MSIIKYPYVYDESTPMSMMKVTLCLWSSTPMSMIKYPYVNDESTPMSMMKIPLCQWSSTPMSMIKYPYINDESTPMSMINFPYVNEQVPLCHCFFEFISWTLPLAKLLETGFCIRHDLKIAGVDRLYDLSSSLYTYMYCAMITKITGNIKPTCTPIAIFQNKRKYTLKHTKK